MGSQGPSPEKGQAIVWLLCASLFLICSSSGQASLLMPLAPAQASGLSSMWLSEGTCQMPNSPLSHQGTWLALQPDPLSLSFLTAPCSLFPFALALVHAIPSVQHALSFFLSNQCPQLRESFSHLLSVAPLLQLSVIHSASVY